MSEIETQSSSSEVLTAEQQNLIAQSADTAQAHYSDHEDKTGHTELAGDAVLNSNVSDNEAEIDTVQLVAEPSTQETENHQTLDDKLKEDPEKVPSAASKQKTSMSNKPPQNKANGTTPITSVKKIISSGTFGSGTVKPTPARPAASSTPPTPKTTTPAASALRKSTSTGPAMSSAKPPTRPTPTVPPSRRASVVPPKTTTLTSPSKQPLSSSVNSRPTADATPAPTNAPSRASVASPTGSVASLRAASTARPRASVSEGVKRAPLANRQSLSGAAPKPTAPTKPPTTARSGVSASAKTTKNANSISSIQEVKEDAKIATGEIEAQLKQAEKTLKIKTDAVVELEDQVEKLKASLESALHDVGSKESLASELEQAKVTVEAELQRTKDAFENLKFESNDNGSVLDKLKKELEESTTAAQASNTLVKSLQDNIATLEAEVAETKGNLEALKAQSASELSLAASAERESVLKAQANLKTMSEEAEALRKAHITTSKELEAKTSDLNSKLAEVSLLQSQLATLKEEKEENAGKLSELEIEILELKEAQESLEDGREQLKGRIQALEEDLSKASSATQSLADEIKAKETEHLAKIEGIQKHHADELSVAADRHSQTLAALEELKNELKAATEAHDVANKLLESSKEAHAAELKEFEEKFAQKHAETTAELEKVTADLMSQESQYNAKVEVVKQEHEKLLQEAFERAKKEAGEAHEHELQGLRSGSNTTIEQIQAANQVALQSLKDEHSAILETETQALKKQISNLTLELKATQDDLAKSKAALETVRSEIESLTKQRDEARVAIDTFPATSPQQQAEISRLTQQLSATNDDLAAMTDIVKLTKASITEMSDNHKLELEEAAKARADEVIKLRASNDEEVASLAKEKSELLVKLSDLEGDLATLKAQISSQVSSPKAETNGAVQPQSPGVTKEELQRLHEAHNLKIYDLQAEHEKSIAALKEQLEASTSQLKGLQQEIGLKAMEIQYLEQEQEENQENITRLTSDLEALKEQYSKGAE